MIKSNNVRYRIFALLVPVLLFFGALMLSLVLLRGLQQFDHAHAAPLEGRTQQNVVVNWSPQTTQLSGTQTITPERSLLIVEPPQALTVTLGEGIEGDQLIIVSDVTTATVVSSTNTTLAANATLGENDVLKFTYIGDQWVDEYTQDN